MLIPNRIQVVTILSLPLLLHFAACGGSDGGSGPENSPPTASIVAGDGGSYNTMLPGDVVKFTVVANDPDAQVLSFEWRLEPAEGSGILTSTSSREAEWTVGTTGSTVSVHCTVSDGIASVDANAGRSYLVGSPAPAGNSWPAAEVPYVLTAQRVVPLGETLTIAEGAVVELRPAKVPGGYAPFGLVVRGSLVVGSPTATDDATLRGNHRIFDGGDFQHRGLIFESNGSGQLYRARVEDAEFGIEQQGGGTIQVVDCEVVDSVVGVLVSGVGSVGIRGGNFHRNGTGIEINSSVASLDDVYSYDNELWGLNITADASGSARANVVDCTFDDNGLGQIRVNTTSSPISLTMRSSDLFGEIGATFVVASPLFCGAIDLDIIGNHWGVPGGPEEIIAMFANGTACNAGVASWSQTACSEPDFSDCDYSPVRFH